MIILHCKPGDPFAKEIEEKLKDLVVAYRVQNYRGSIAGSDLPYIQEGETVVTGQENIKSYLYQLSSDLQQQRSVTGDGCYLDPDTGKIC